MEGTLFSIPQLWIRLIGAGLCIALLAFFVNPLLLGIRHAGCYAGGIVCILGAVFFLCNAPISQLLGRLWHGQNSRVLLCIILGFLALCAVLAVGISIGMTHAILKKPKAESTVVVLGCKVRGTAPSLMLQRRLDAAYDYLAAHPDVPVIVCGGQGADEEISEAQCMAEYLTGRGIAEERIYREPQSVSTYENLRNASEILDENGWERHITVVTDGFHQYRASLIAKECGMTCDAVSAKTAWYLTPSYWVREWMGVCALFVFGTD